MIRSRLILIAVLPFLLILWVMLRAFVWDDPAIKWPWFRAALGDVWDKGWPEERE